MSTTHLTRIEREAKEYAASKPQYVRDIWEQGHKDGLQAGENRAAPVVKALEDLHYSVWQHLSETENERIKQILETYKKDNV